MVWLVIAYIVMGIALAAFIGTGAYIIAAIVAAMMIVPCALRLYRALTTKPSTMVCPNCGSGQVKITSRVEGVTGNSESQFKRSLLMPHHRFTVSRQGGSKLNRQRVAVCQSCGFDYSYFTAAEIKQERTAALTSAVIVGVVTILCIVFGLLSK